MEARIGSAAAASTSHSCSVSSWSGLRVLRNTRRAWHRPCSERVRLQKVSAKSLEIRANAVARESKKLKEVSRVNGAAKVEGQRKLPNGELGNAFNVGIPPTHCPNQEKHVVAGLNTWIGALATAILAIEKQKRITDDSKLEVLDTMRQGKLIENELVYRQTFVIRSYEAGFDKSASIETIANLFQETALNHVGLSKFVGDGMGTTHAMMRHRLIWVVTRMHVEVDRYPVWGDVVEIDSWVAGEGKNGMRRDFIVRDYATGEVIARATSIWVMMNQDTRRLSKMPQEVLAEISPHFLDKKCIQSSEGCQKIKKLNDSAPYIRSDLVPRLRDMDMNQHVNNVKYISWVLESVPQSLLVAHELASMTLEYRRECTPSDVVQSLSCPDTHLSLNPFMSEMPLPHGGLDGSPDAVSCHSGALKSPTISPTTTEPKLYTHLLRMQQSGADIVMGRTKWRVKDRYVGAH
ncbi:hypothetical protein M758_5G111500 [Ceratodon purpureus]|nr:hypothetical protein M758_5G111500 [Ceratodon purpureus]